MISITEKQNCCGCGACRNACPRNCITMAEDEEGFLYPKVDASCCVDCGLCSRVCVFQREEPLPQKETPCYAAVAKDDAIRAASSSGGVFSLLAGRILAMGGVVYGVAMKEDMRSCAFLRVLEADELPKLQGSKYLQADVGETYREVKRDLEAGKQVLFSGVPCQIDALKLFLNREYENLYCAEVICHGTPSSLLWSRYIDYVEQRHQDRIQTVQFRSKKSGWRKFGLAIDGTKFHQNQSLSDNPFLRMFLRNICLRPSCYHCQSKKLASGADLTLGDFWGIWKISPEMDDDRGTSLILVQTQKGAELLRGIEGSIVSKEMPFAISIASNSAYNKSVSRPKERDTFFTDLNAFTFDEMIHKYCALSAKEKIKRSVKRSVLYKAIKKSFSDSKDRML